MHSHEWITKHVSYAYSIHYSKPCTDSHLMKNNNQRSYHSLYDFAWSEPQYFRAHTEYHSLWWFEGECPSNIQILWWVGRTLSEGLRGVVLLDKIDPWRQDLKFQKPSTFQMSFSFLVFSDQVVVSSKSSATLPAWWQAPKPWWPWILAL